MEELLKFAEPAMSRASERLIELVDRVLNRDRRTRQTDHAADSSSARRRESWVAYDDLRAS